MNREQIISANLILLLLQQFFFLCSCHQNFSRITTKDPLLVRENWILLWNGTGLYTDMELWSLPYLLHHLWSQSQTSSVISTNSLYFLYFVYFWCDLVLDHCLYALVLGPLRGERGVYLYALPETTAACITITGRDHLRETGEIHLLYLLLYYTERGDYREEGLFLCQCLATQSPITMYCSSIRVHYLPAICFIFSRRLLWASSIDHRNTSQTSIASLYSKRRSLHHLNDCPPGVMISPHHRDHTPSASSYTSLHNMNSCNCSFSCRSSFPD